MAKPVTPDQIVADAYMYANLVTGSNAFVPAVQALRLVNLACGGFYDLLVSARGHGYYINEATIPVFGGSAGYNFAAEFYDLLVSARGHEYYINEATIPILGGTSRYNLPADFYELFSVTIAWGPQDVEEIPDYGSVRDRAAYQNGLQWSRRNTKAFRLRGPQIEFLPVPGSPITATLQYLPAFPDLVLGGTSFDGVNGWERLIALRAAMDM